MRKTLPSLAALGLATLFCATPGTAAEIDVRQMDLTEGPWALGTEGETCQLILGDAEVEGGRHLDGGAECSGINPALGQATKWRIDVPHELVFLNDGGRVLAKMNYDEAKSVFTGISANGDPLVLSQSE